MAGAWGAIGSALQGLGTSTITGLTNSFGGSQLQTRLNKEDTAWLHALQSLYYRADTQWYNDNILSTAYQRTRKSLEDAGYNPLMALNAGPLAEQGPMNQSSAMETNERSFNKSSSISKLANAQIQNINADTDLKTSQTRLTSAQEATEQERKDLVRVEKEINEINKQLQKGNLNWQEKNMLLNQRKILSEVYANYTNADIKRLLTKSEISLNSANEELQRNNLNYQNKHPFLYSIGKAGNDILPIAGVAGAIGYGANSIYNRYKPKKKIGF